MFKGHAYSAVRRWCSHWLWIPVIGAFAAALSYSWLGGVVINRTDTQLAVGLYIVGALFVLMGGFVSIRPPQNAHVRSIFFTLFLLFFYFGFRITSEQGRRIEQASLKSEAVAGQYEENQRRSEKEIELLTGNVEGIRATIATLATQPGGEKWNSVLEQIRRIQQPPKAIAPPTIIMPPPIVQISKGCEIGSRQWSDCTPEQVVAWGKPLMLRLDKAIKKKQQSLWQRMTANPPKNSRMAALSENIELNQFLTDDYRNLLLYQSAVLAKLKGGDPSGDDPMGSPDFDGRVLVKPDGEKDLMLLDIDSQMGWAIRIQDYLTRLTDALVRQQ